MIDFKSAAKKETVLSELMSDRKQLSTDEVIAKFPNGFTVCEFDIVCVKDKDGENKAYPIVTIKEDESVYINGGCVLSKICENWVDAYDGDISAASNDLKSCGGVKIKLESAKTKAGRNITRVSII